MVVGGSDRGISEEGGEGELSGVADKRAVGWKENSTVPMVKRKKTRTKKNSAR
jgi:hypothetical protein